MSRQQFRTCVARFACMTVVGFVGACNERSPAQPKPNERVAYEAATVSATTSTAREAKVETLLTLDGSAYGVRLLLTGSTWTLVTSGGLYRKEGETPVVHVPGSLRAPLVLMGEEIVYWAEGELVARSVSATSTRRLALLEQMPRDVFASKEHFAWLERGKHGDRIGVAAKTAKSDDTTQRFVYASENQIVSGAVLQDWVFFVEALPQDKWRLGAVSLRSTGANGPAQAVTQGALHSGRPPAFLVAESELYFYDGPTRSVRRVTPDLQEETTVARGVICSPMAISERIYCAHVGGVFSVDESNADEKPSKPIDLDRHIKGPITAIAADSQKVIWVEDLDGKQLRVRAAALR